MCVLLSFSGDYKNGPLFVPDLRVGEAPRPDANKHGANPSASGGTSPPVVLIPGFFFFFIVVFSPVNLIYEPFFFSVRKHTVPAKR